MRHKTGDFHVQQVATEILDRGMAFPLGDFPFVCGSEAHADADSLVAEATKNANFLCFSFAEANGHIIWLPSDGSRLKPVITQIR